MTQEIRLGNFRIAPGERRALELPLPALYSHTPVSLPVYVINGKKPGPVLFVCAAIHGDEINGVEIIRRLLRTKAVNKIKGALVAVPVVNVYGFITRSRYLPDRRDLNRAFPGSDTGSMAGRLADTFLNQIVNQCSHGIDLHTGAIGRENLPQIRARIENAPLTEQMAHAFGAPLILNSEIVEGSLRRAVAEKIPVLVYEAGEALRFDEVAIRAGVKGITRVMRHLEMLPSRKDKSPVPKPLIANSSRWVRAPQSGIMRSIVPLGAHVQKDQTIGWVADPFGEREAEIQAPVPGIVIGRNNLPLVHEGEALYHIAVFSEPRIVAESVEAFQEEYNPDGERAPGDEPPII
ncbi:MAG: succinylglutamate desuccinylase/aspartoacylase family protein [Gammaproteobacteria bacterium]|nr:succinylglutamate desuccinylase/aspartoacylase family protein [Pseudomonadales bacterium]MCP5345295.1 succinylglutamate desuccinylase/aspartoacylase family protein [Pseudomonadales bacterium]